MNYLTPDLARYGYEITGQLGQNLAGGRITFKALRSDTQDLVAIKQFAFYRSNWKAYDAIANEVQTLSNLTHPQIPKLIESFQTDDGFFLVQEYVDGKPLSEIGQCSLLRTIEIARQLLEMLVYLQNQSPIVLHRDIKPENIILVETETKPEKKPIVYLVDFGLAKTAGQSTGVSSIVAGTPGFMPPEAILGQALTPASDIYSLGVTLIGLLTGVKSSEVSLLIDPSTFNVRYTTIDPPLYPALEDWFAMMVARDPELRFSNAKIALNALELAVLNQSLARKIQTNGALTRAKVGLIVGGVAAIATLGIFAANNLTTIENFFPRQEPTSEPPIVRPVPKPTPPQAPSAQSEQIEEMIDSVFGVGRIVFGVMLLLTLTSIVLRVGYHREPLSEMGSQMAFVLVCAVILVSSEIFVKSLVSSHPSQLQSSPLQEQPVPIFLPLLR